MGRISQAFKLGTITPANAHVVADWIKSARARNRASTQEPEPLVGLDIQGQAVDYGCPQSLRGAATATRRNPATMR